MSVPVHHPRVLRYVGYLLLALVIIFFDQYTKQLAYSELAGRGPVELLPVFKLALVFNQGAAFGFLGDAGGWQRFLFISLAVVFSIVLVIWIWRVHSHDTWLSTGLGLVLGGAIGNLIDRVEAGYVIDFLVLHYQGWYFPAFNIADIAITVGAIMLIIDSLFFTKD